MFFSDCDYFKRMSTPSRLRLMRDFKQLQKDPPAGISAVPSDDNILIWHAFILGLEKNINLEKL